MEKLTLLPDVDQATADALIVESKLLKERILYLRQRLTSQAELDVLYERFDQVSWTLAKYAVEKVNAERAKRSHAPLVR